MIKVSVIIPVYNVERYLPACLDSVLSQSLSDIEVICIDDASPDGCPRILDDYAARDSRVRVFHLEQNRQQGYGRNLGIDSSVGKYLYFLDSDDMIAPGALEDLYDMAESGSLDGVFFDSKVIFENEHLALKNASYPAVHSGRYEDRVYDGRALFESFVLQRDWTCYVQRQFWKRSFLTENSIRFPEGTEHEDEFFAFSAVNLASRVRYVPRPYFIRRYREGSVMTRKASPKDFHGYFRTFCLMKGLASEKGLEGRAVDAETGRIYEKMERFYPQFAASEDPRDWFASDEELRLYRFFEQTQRSSAYYEEIVKKALKKVPAGSEIWIYGAGVIAKNVWRGLSLSGAVVRGFLVTDPQKDPPALFGHPVKGVFDQEAEEGTAVIIAVSGGYVPQIRQTLEDRGWKDIVTL